MFPPLVPIVLLTLHAALVDCALTFKHTDPSTGTQLVCEGCAPGTYLRAPCKATSRSECAPCPPGSYTELGNYIRKCLRCSVCGRYEVVRTACTAHSNTQCACKEGFYLNKQHDICMRHSACPSGQGVLSKGTSDENTVCHVCSNGTFSDGVSAHHNCTKSQSCDCPRQHLLLRSAPWHDSVCTSCEELRDGASHLREILPAFFVHHSMSVKRLRRLVHHLPSEDGKKQGVTAALQLPELNARVNAWIASAAEKQIRQLPDVLKTIGAESYGERLHSKLQRIDAAMKQLCGAEGNEVDAV
ncbi:tumor necrosis factor receptor superfamily member 6B [Hippoglossus stenolepis]|uniref:tumor necrosis factor receptor superfamily member 6B n=1 Tax=Hippoglossus stenolepis TaxID=195615 RepID=UPI00159CABBA|nr:tumor necrosis factor receptor superfamily member 6B [Hippoglossus stenolepis]